MTLSLDGGPLTGRASSGTAVSPTYTTTCCAWPTGGLTVRVRAAPAAALAGDGPVTDGSSWNVAGLEASAGRSSSRQGR